MSYEYAIHSVPQTFEPDNVQQLARTHAVYPNDSPESLLVIIVLQQPSLWNMRRTGKKWGHVLLIRMRRSWRKQQALMRRVALGRTSGAQTLVPGSRRDPWQDYWCVFDVPVFQGWGEMLQPWELIWMLLMSRVSRRTKRPSHDLTNSNSSRCSNVRLPLAYFQASRRSDSVETLGDVCDILTGSQGRTEF